MKPSILNYAYEHEDQVYTIKLDTGGELKAYMEGNGFLAYYGCDCDIELDFTSDDLKSLIFFINGLYWTGLSIAQWCMDNHYDDIEEAEREEREYSDNARWLSCPRLSGRI